MTYLDPARIYSLYNEDDGVVIYDCREDAAEQKARLEGLVPVEGPFEHPRIEQHIIFAAQQALHLLRQLHRDKPHLEHQQLTRVIKQLEGAFDSLTDPAATR